MPVINNNHPGQDEKVTITNIEVGSKSHPVKVVFEDTAGTFILY